MKSNRVRDRFLAQLDNWLTDGLLYYAFTGEPVSWDHANNEYRRELLFNAGLAWPDRLRRIEQSRLAK
jgi:hypothetical protein